MLAAARTVPDLLVFLAAALMVLSGAVGVVVSRNPVHSALCLIATLLGVALAFIAQGANFLAAVQVIVYAGAIVILFLFVIMFLGVDRSENLRIEPLEGQRPLAFVGVAVVTGGLIALLAKGGWYSGARSVAGATHPGSDVQQLGRSVFTTYLFAFEATSLLLVIAVVGAVLLARRTKATPPGPTAGTSATPPAGEEAPDGDMGASDATLGAGERS